MQENIEKNGDAPVSDPVMQKRWQIMNSLNRHTKRTGIILKNFMIQGVTVLAGTDMVMYHSPLLPLPREPQYMVEYGITPVQAVQVATPIRQRFWGVEKERGLVAEGLDAVSSW